MSRRSASTVVYSKYGDRPLIDMPPLYLDGRRSSEDKVPNHMFRVPGKKQHGKVFHQPPRGPQPSLTVPPSPQRYHYPHHQTDYNQRYSHKQPFHSNEYQVPSLLPLQENPYSNLVQESNVVPYDTYNHQPQTLPMMQTQPQAVPVIPPSYVQAPPQGMPNNNEVHIYYGPNGERLNGPPQVPRFPTDFTLEGTLEYGKLVSVSVRNSNISYREVPDFVFSDLKKTYGMIEKTEIKIVAQGGEYNIYASPTITDDVGRVHGYMYEPRDADFDPYTKRYRYNLNYMDELFPGNSSPKADNSHDKSSQKDNKTDKQEEMESLL